MGPHSATGKGRIDDSFCSEMEFRLIQKLRPEIALNQGFRANSGAKSMS
jgi:hypothetical protein